MVSGATEAEQRAQIAKAQLADAKAALQLKNEIAAKKKAKAHGRIAKLKAKASGATKRMPLMSKCRGGGYPRRLTLYLGSAILKRLRPFGGAVLTSGAPTMSLSLADYRKMIASPPSLDGLKAQVAKLELALNSGQVDKAQAAKIVDALGRSLAYLDDRARLARLLDAESWAHR